MLWFTGDGVEIIMVEVEKGMCAFLPLCTWKLISLHSHVKYKCQFSFLHVSVVHMCGYAVCVRLFTCVWVQMCVCICLSVYLCVSVSMCVHVEARGPECIFLDYSPYHRLK